MAVEWAAGLWKAEAEQLEGRTPLFTDRHQMRGMFFTSTLECARRALGEEAVKSIVADAGIGASFSAMKKYPLRNFHKLRIVAARRLEPSLGSLEAAVARIGYAAVEIFFESVAGRTMMLLAGKDPHRLMGAAPNGYGLGVEDDATRSYTKTGENSGTFDFTNDLLGPCHEWGTFSCAIATVCKIDPKVRIEQPTLVDFKFHVTW